MKKNKKLFISFGIILVVAIAATLLIINITKDSNRLNVIEKQWINNNNKMVFNIGVKNNLNVFASDGVGVFYDFLTDFSNEYNLTINPTTYTNNDSTESIYFRITNNLNDHDLVFYQDHFVIVGKTNNSFNDLSELQNRNIGVLNENVSLISDYLQNNNLSFTQFNDKEQLITEFNKKDKINYIIVPLNEYLDSILENENYVNMHISDIPIYYTLNEEKGDEVFSSIIKKYYNNWIEENYNNHYNKELYEFFTDNLNISEEQNDKLHSKTYNYGFIENRPYETLSGSNYGGIASIYLDKFKDFSNLDIKYTRFKNKNSLVRAINKKEIDLFFNYFNIISDYENISNLFNISFDVIVKDNDNKVINSLKALENEEVYVLENSLLNEYLSNYNYLNIQTYKDNKDLKKLAKKDKIIILDSNTFKYYQNNSLKDYTKRYSDYISKTYNFNSNANETFNKLLTNFLNITDYQMISNEGLYNNKVIVHKGTIMGKIASYILYIILIAIVVILIAYKYTKRVKIAKRIKKEDKMRFIDQLTSLKNRNYLNENIEAWNKNTIYPQTTLIIDLNNIQYINDTYGYEEGDKQIKAAANILIKLQIDNTDIIRTDGTEFLVYFVGHSEKQIASFMRKLNKEFKKLPYDFGVVMGYSVINDDIKLIEDAINEATLAVKEKKSEKDTLEDEEKI